MKSKKNTNAKMLLSISSDILTPFKAMCAASGLPVSFVVATLIKRANAAGFQIDVAPATPAECILPDDSDFEREN
jgi:hypothetical protein